MKEGYTKLTEDEEITIRDDDFTKLTIMAEKVEIKDNQLTIDLGEVFAGMVTKEVKFIVFDIAGKKYKYKFVKEDE